MFHWKRYVVIPANYRKIRSRKLPLQENQTWEKSSLINALMNRKALARTSGQPGKTQTINFYNVNDELYLTDLPGYGFAKVSQKEKEKWGTMIENYTEQFRTAACCIFAGGYPS